MKWELWVRVELDKGREPAAIEAEMLSEGWEAPAATELVSRIQQVQVLDYQEAAAERDEWTAARGKYRRGMLVGGICFLGGLVVSIRGFLVPGSVGALGVIFAGLAIALGLSRFAVGLSGYLRPMSPRLKGQYVPGRRIGAYAPGTPRSRYSRFQ